jgi:hypothetical protein
LLLTLRYSNADRQSGHEYNADVITRTLRVRAGDRVLADLAFPFTHDWSNFRELSVVIEVPVGTERLTLERGVGAAPLIAGAVLEPVDQESAR